MAIKIQNTADIEFVGVKCIIYGGAGVGKTIISKLPVICELTKLLSMQQALFSDV